MRYLLRFGALAVGLLLCCTYSMSAQSNGERVEAFNVDGITVIVSPADNELVSVIIGLEGGIAGGETTNPALGEFATDLLTSSGSTRFNKDDLRAFTSRTSSTIIGDGDNRGVSFRLTSTRSNFDKAWEMIASIVASPVYDSMEFRNIMEQRINDVKRRWTSPDDYSTIIADSLLRLGNPVLGREVRQSDVEEVTIPAISAFMKRITERSRMIVVVVGKVTASDIRAKLQAFASIPKGNYKPVKIAPLTQPKAPRIEVVEKKSPTTYVRGVFAGPRYSDNDFWALQVGLSHLNSVLFREVRTKRNLSYAPGSGLGGDLGSSYGIIAVSSTRPDSAITVMLNELTAMRSGKFDAKDLEASKQVFITNYYQRQMTNSGVAGSLYSAQRHTGTWKHAFSLDLINKVTKAQVQKALTRYAHNLQFGVVGMKSSVTESKYLYR